MGALEGAPSRLAGLGEASCSARVFLRSLIVPANPRNRARVTRKLRPIRSYTSESEGQAELPAGGDAVSPEDYSKFVRFMHLASPYVVGHRGRVFVVVLPGEVIARKDRLYPLLEDITLLHGLGVRVVIVAGAAPLIDDFQRRSGREPTWVGAYRVTDAETLRAAIAAAGSISTEISACLSKAPSIPMVRRHARGDGQFHFAPAVQVVSGNYVTAKRRGIVNGVDFEFMGQVRFVQREALRRQLDAGNVVLLNNVGVSAAGELLNCNCYDVAVHAAVELQADKLICLTGADVRPLGLPHYLPLDDAEQMIAAAVCGDEDGCSTGSLDGLGESPALVGSDSDDGGSGGGGGGGGGGWDGWDGRGSFSSNGNGGGSGRGAALPAEMQLDLDSWQQIGFPNAVVSATVACKRGVNRAHLVDAENDGAILLELYTRDGIPGVCMIAADLYEGIRPAEPRDAPGVAQLLRLLVAQGLTAPPPPGDGERLRGVTVIEREGKVLGCCYASNLGTAPDGLRVAEISAFVIDPSYRRQGFGDSLLDFVEQGLRREGYRRVVVVAGQGSWEWFAQRGFELAGDAANATELLPARRREAAPPVAKLYVKPILELDASLDAPAGKRIGF